MLRHGRHFIEMKRMFVRPQARGQRFGQAILHFLEQLGRNESFVLARLETGIHQAEAMRLYEGAGYRRVGAFGSYADNGVSIFFERDLRIAEPT
jgi:GNAT superfamily N-acetyltransferase